MNKAIRSTQINNKKLMKKFESFSNNRTFFIEQLLGILQFSIKKGLKTKTKRILNNLITKLYLKDNRIVYKFNNKLTKFKQAYKIMDKRKKKWKRRNFSIKQKEIRVTPFLRKNFFTNNFKRFYRRRSRKYAIFLNSEEQLHYIKKIYIDLVKGNKSNKLINTFEKQISHFLSLKTVETKKILGWIKYITRGYVIKENMKKKDTIPKSYFSNDNFREGDDQIYFKKIVEKNEISSTRETLTFKFMGKNKHFIKSFLIIKISNKLHSKKVKFVKTQKKKKSKTLLSKISRYKKEKHVESLIPHSRRQSDNIIYSSLYKNMIKTTSHFKMGKRYFHSNNQYELSFYSFEKYNLKKVKKFCENIKSNTLKKNILIKPIQKRIKKITILKSPHVNKTARNQYDQITYKLSLKVQNDSYNHKAIFDFILKVKTYFSYLDFTFRSKN